MSRYLRPGLLNGVRLPDVEHVPTHRLLVEGGYPFSAGSWTVGIRAYSGESSAAATVAGKAIMRTPATGQRVRPRVGKHGANERLVRISVDLLGRVREPRPVTMPQPE